MLINLNFLLGLLITWFNNSNALIKDSVYYEQQLVTYLFDKGAYVKTVRPSPCVEGNISLSLRQIVSIDEKNQIMTSNSYISLYWIDSRLDWDPEYNYNITSIVIPVSNLWIPDLVVINSANSNGFFSLSDSLLASLNNKGEVSISFSAVGLQTRCKMDISKFPFDTQTCSIIIGSWAQSTQRINFDTDEGSVDTSNYNPNAVWTLKDINVQQLLTKQRNSIGSKSQIEDIYFNFVLKRGPLFIMMNGIFPCLVLNLVTLLSYNMPFPSQVALSMTIFLTFSVYSLSLTNYIPVQSQFLPLINLYIILAISFTLLSLIWFIIKNSFQTKNKMPEALMKFAGFLQYVFFLKNVSNKNPQVKRAPVETNRNKKQQKEDLKADPSDSKLPEISKPKPCMKCESCDICKAEKEKEAEQKQKKKNFDLSVSALNRFMLMILILAMLISNLSIWLRLSS